MTSTNAFESARCTCGRLLARKTLEGYELKCPRCKTIWQLPFDESKALQWVSSAADRTGESHDA